MSTSTLHAEMIHSLKIARSRLLKNPIRYSFICAALKDTAHAPLLKEWIKHQLAGEVYYETWMWRFYPYTARQMSSLRDFRRGRIQWIDAMIEELSKD